MSCRDGLHLVLAWLVLCFAFGQLQAGENIDPSLAKADPKEPILWYDVRHLGVEGQGWKETKSPFDRLPAKAEEVVRKPVWDLSRHSAGLCVRFAAEATTM